MPRDSTASLNCKGRDHAVGWAALGFLAVAAPAIGQQVPVLGETYAHDPSTITNVAGVDFYYSTGQGILSRRSTDLSNWSDGPAVFAANPAWTTADVPGFTGTYWAPEISYFGGLYHLYYAVSTFGSQVSGIGLATSPTLNPATAGYGWTDYGPVITSTNGSLYNTIDPSIIITPNGGGTWMSFGSYWTGIYEVQINPATGLRLNNNAPIHLSVHNDSAGDNEASYLYYNNGYYYLFENWGSCCSGTASTYNVRMGRSTSVNGPFVDQSGASLLSGGGSLFMSATGNYIGPGQVGIYTQNGTSYLSYHYYNGANGGTPALGIRQLHWDANGWPTVLTNPAWSTSGTGTIVDGGGTWDLASNDFVTGQSAHTFENSGYTVPTFGSAAGPAGVVNLAQPVFVQGMTFNAASSGTYTIAGASSITFGLNSTLTANAAATITAPVTAGVFTKTGTAAVTFGGAVTANNLFLQQGTVNLTGAGSFTTANNSSSNNYVSIGQTPGNFGTLSLSGSSSFTAAGDFNIADVGAAGNPTAGVLYVAGTAVVSARTMFVGKYVNAIGTVNQTGGTVQEADNGAAPGDWRIGGAGSFADAASVGTYNISGGTLNVGRANFQIGAYGTGTIIQTGGAVVTGSNGGGYLSIGRFPGGTGLYDMSTGNGTLNETAGPSVLVVGEQGAGTLKVGGSSAVIANGLSVGHNNGGVGTVVQTGGTVTLGTGGLQFGPVASATGAAATGIYNLSGGLLVTPSVSQNTAATVTGTIYFNGGTLTASAGGTLIPTALSHAVVSTGGATINTAGNFVTIAAPLIHDPALNGFDGGLTKLGTGTLALSGTDTFNGPTTVSAGTLDLDLIGGIRSVDGITVSTGTTLVTASTNASRTVIKSPTLSLAGTVGNWTGSVNIAGDDLDLASASLATVTDQVRQGYGTLAGGAWTGVGGINSFTAAADSRHLTAVGVVQNNQSGSPIYSATHTFDGDTPAAADVLVKYTWFGDADLDGRVDGSDYTLIDAGYGSYGSKTGWYDGDFNYDGVIDGSDYALIDNAYNNQTTTLATSAVVATVLVATAPAQPATAPAAVPEPASIFYAAAAGLACRRRGRRLQRSAPLVGHSSGLAFIDTKQDLR